MSRTGGNDWNSAVDSNQAHSCAGLAEEYSNWITENLRASGRGSRSFLGGLGNRRSFAAALGFRWRGRGFTDQFGGHNARYEKLGAVIVKIHCGAFLVGSGHDSQAVHFVLDGLTFLHYLHNALLGHSLKLLIRISWGEPTGTGSV